MDLAPERLVELVGCFSKGRDAGSSYVTIDELTDALSSLAVALREGALRETALAKAHRRRGGSNSARDFGSAPKPRKPVGARGPG